MEDVKLLKDRKDINIKIRNCEVEQAFSCYDTNKIADIETRIKWLTNIKFYAIGVHDKDNELPHFHAMLTFSKPTTIWAVAKALKVEPQYVNKFRSTSTNAYLYLVHRNDQTKFQYSPEDIVANFDYVEFASKHWAKNQKESIASRIASWEIKKYNLYDFISIQEYALYESYYDKCFKYRQYKQMTWHRDMQCVFISWLSGAWKTYFAKKLAEDYGYSYYISSCWKNAFDDYKDQECIILDDLRENVFNLADFLKFTDNNTNSLVECRFYNKPITECKLIILTSTKTIYDFYSWLNASEWEELNQVLRRFKTYAVVWHTTINFYQYNEITKDYTYEWTIENPLVKLKAEENREDNPVIKDILTKFWNNVIQDKEDKIAITLWDDNTDELPEEAPLFPKCIPSNI